jgi:hypothetical protein
MRERERERELERERERTGFLKTEKDIKIFLQQQAL